MIEESLSATDHRRLGRELGLFHVQEEAAGSVMWHPKGHALFRAIETYIRDKLRRADYVEVKTPQLVNKSLWQASGHWDKYRHNMYVTGDSFEFDDAGLSRFVAEGDFALKPMNCPCHVQVFNAQTVSYRQLPMRMAEFGCCHRAEPSGALHGIMRLRQFTQDDAHIFCTKDQVVDETARFIRLLIGVYRDFGFEAIKVGLSTRPALRGGTEEMWDHAEEALAAATRATGIDFETYPGEGAFYGPKLEFALRDLRGREWQCGTLQLDFLLPKRLGAEYVGEDGQRHQPVMLHRAILGSLERFIGILLEHHEGALPAWLAPVQVAVLTVKSDEPVRHYARDIVDRLEQMGLRVSLDTRDTNLNSKVKEHLSQKTPLVVVVGERDRQNKSLVLRRLGQTAQQVLKIDEALETMTLLCAITHMDLGRAEQETDLSDTLMAAMHRLAGSSRAEMLRIRENARALVSLERTCRDRV